MWGCHGCTGDSIGGIFAALPGGEDVQARSEDVITFAEIGKISSFISKSGCAHSNGIGRSGRRVVAGIGVVITCCDCKM